MNDQPISPAQASYLKKRKREHAFIGFFRVLIFVLFVALWEISAFWGWIDSFIFCSPSKIAAVFVRMLSDGSLLLHIGVTLSETLFSFFLITVLGILGAVLLWSFPLLAALSEPYLVVLNSLPKSALAPVFIVWLGSNPKTIIVAAVSVALFGTIITLYYGFLETESDKIKLIYTLGGSKRQVLTKVVLPSNLLLILSQLKVNIGLSLVGVIIGEFLAAKEGLGYLIIYGSQVFKLDMVMMSIMILCVLATLLYKILSTVEKKVHKFSK